MHGCNGRSRPNEEQFGGNDQRAHERENALDLVSQRFQNLARPIRDEEDQGGGRRRPKLGRQFARPSRRENEQPGDCNLPEVGAQVGTVLHGPCRVIDQLGAPPRPKGCVEDFGLGQPGRRQARLHREVGHNAPRTSSRFHGMYGTARTPRSEVPDRACWWACYKAAPWVFYSQSMHAISSYQRPARAGRPLALCVGAGRSCLLQPTALPAHALSSWRRARFHRRMASGIMARQRRSDSRKGGSRD